MHSDIHVFDDLVPKLTQQRILDSVTDYNLHWMDFDAKVAAGDHWKGRDYSCDGLTIKEARSLVKLAYTGGVKHIGEEPQIMQPECFYYMGQFILDLALEKAGLELEKILRIKINKQTQFPGFDENTCNGIHTDTSVPHMVAIYYINDSDGDTFIMNEKLQPEHEEFGAKVHTTVAARVTPKQGRIVLFDGLRYHAPSNPIKFADRYIMNINFQVK